MAMNDASRYDEGNLLEELAAMRGTTVSVFTVGGSFAWEGSLSTVGLDFIRVSTRNGDVTRIPIAAIAAISAS